MPYIKETVKCGQVIEVRKYYSVKFHKKEDGRNPKTSPTSEAQKKINLKEAETKLRRILNASFAPGDYHVTLTYDPRISTPAFDEAKKNITLFIRRLCRKGKGKFFRYIYINGVGKRRMHHHLVISADMLPYIKECWTWGRPFFVPLSGSGDYSSLAAYLAKHFESAKAAGEKKFWHGSRNLIHPVPKKEVIKSNSYSEKPKAVSGYYIDADSVDFGVSDFTGYPFLTYRMIKIQKGSRMRN